MPDTIDGSIIGKLQVPQLDALGTATKATALAGGLLNNRLVNQQIGGKEALGRAVTAATDSATGKTDWAKAQSLLAQDSQGAFAMPEFAGQVQERGLKELSLGKEELDLSAKRWAKVGDTATAILTSKEPLTRDAVIKSLADNLVGSGMFNDEKSVGMLTQFVQKLPDDDKGLREALKQVGLQSNMTQERIAALLGTPSTVDTGANIVQQQISPVTGDIRVNGMVPKERTPSERAAMVKRFNKETQTYEEVPSGQVIGDGVPGAPPGAPPITVQSGPALGVAEGVAGAAANAVQQQSALRAAADKVPLNKASLQNIRSQLDNFTPGPKANWTYILGAMAQQLGVAAPKVTEGVAAQEEFNKLATQWINSQMGALGGSGTDSKLESARHGSPNEFMSKEGIKGVTNLMLGLEDATAAKNVAWQKWLDAGNGPETYGKFQTQFNGLFNPRVFQSVYMSEGQKTTMLKGMTEAERKQFQKDWTFAKKAGWLQ